MTIKITPMSKNENATNKPDWRLDFVGAVFENRDQKIWDHSCSAALLAAPNNGKNGEHPGRHTPIRWQTVVRESTT
jgi:hypothetical protein